MLKIARFRSGYNAIPEHFKTGLELQDVICGMTEELYNSSKRIPEGTAFDYPEEGVVVPDGLIEKENPDGTISLYFPDGRKWLP